MKADRFSSILANVTNQLQ